MITSSFLFFLSWELREMSHVTIAEKERAAFSSSPQGCSPCLSLPTSLCPLPPLHNQAPPAPCVPNVRPASAHPLYLYSTYKRILRHEVEDGGSQPREPAAGRARSLAAQCPSTVLTWACSSPSPALSRPSPSSPYRCLHHRQTEAASCRAGGGPRGGRPGSCHSPRPRAAC